MIRWVAFIAASIVAAWVVFGRMAAASVLLMALAIGFETWRTWPAIPNWWASIPNRKEPPGR